MIVLDQNGDSGAPLQSLEYIAHRGILGKIVLPITRYLRASNVMRYISPSQRILDIGCGDGYFLRRAPFRERYGVDKRLGDDVEQGLPFDSDFFDCVTMLAVIEHISDTGRLLEEIHRVLKPSGQLVLTTPKKAAEALIRIYVKGCVPPSGVRARPPAFLLVGSRRRPEGRKAGGHRAVLR